MAAEDRKKVVAKAISRIEKIRDTAPYVTKNFRKSDLQIAATRWPKWKKICNFFEKELLPMHVQEVRVEGKYIQLFFSEHEGMDLVFSEDSNLDEKKVRATLALYRHQVNSLVVEEEEISLDTWKDEDEISFDEWEDNASNTIYENVSRMFD
jgi:hypothetical protein